jgi:hypothetical protein
MDAEGYPEEWELMKLRNWYTGDFMNLIQFLEARWHFKNYFKFEWKKDGFYNSWYLHLELHSAGWSGNESMINAILSNFHFHRLWYAEWRRGGHHLFEIHPENVGFQLVSKFCEENKLSKQSVYQSAEKYEWIQVSPRVRFVKPKK